MQKVQLIDIIRSRLSNAPKKFHKEIVSYNIALGFNSIFFKMFKDLNLDQHCKPYKCEVLKDEFDEYYIVLPERIVNLPDYPSGVRRISRMSGDKSEIVPVTKDSVSTFADMDMSFIDYIGYYLSPPNVKFFNWNTDIKNVRVDLVRPFESYDEDEEIYVPGGMDEELVNNIVNFLLGTPPVDAEAD